MDHIRFDCRECGRAIITDRGGLGFELSCPHCSKTVPVPWETIQGEAQDAERNDPWYYLDELNRPSGPCTIEQVRQFNPNRDPFVRNEDMADWALASTLPAFTASATSSPPPPSSTTGLLVKLPLDEPPPPVQFEGKRFCFVGKFAFGSLKKCEATVMAPGGSTQTFPSSNTDFVVIGTVGCGVLRLSSNWAKVEKALALKSEGSRCAIVTENHWVNSLKAKYQRAEGSNALAAFPPIDQIPRQSPQSAANPHQIGVFPLELRDLSLPLDVYAAPTAFEVGSSSGEGIVPGGPQGLHVHVP